MWMLPTFAFFVLWLTGTLSLGTAILGWLAWEVLGLIVGFFKHMAD